MQLKALKDSMKKVCIVDYGLGNVRSVKNSIINRGVEVCISNKKEDLQNSSHLIIPGVGSFESGMRGLEKRDLIDILNQEILYEKKPILGICLGMQLFSTVSYEYGEHKGLDWIAGSVKKIENSYKSDQTLRLPHMGWNDTENNSKSVLMRGLGSKSIFYFVHTYHFIPDSKNVISSTSNYGSTIVASVEKNNIFGVQFHPEKSDIHGKQILKNFLKTEQC